MKKTIISIMLIITLLMTTGTAAVFADGETTSDSAIESGTEVNTGESNEEENVNAEGEQSDDTVTDPVSPTEPAITAQPYDFGTVIKVGVKYGSSATASYTLASDFGFYIGTFEESVFTPVFPVTAYTSLIISRENGATAVKGSDGNIVLADLGNYAIAGLDYNEKDRLTLDGQEFRDAFIFTVNSSGTINAVNVLALDHYVYGVLNAEMWHENPMEALKAQAVTARSYAAKNIKRHATYGFDVCTTTHCQVYRGCIGEYARTNQAVDETAGLMLYYNGSPVSGYYSKNSGGYTQDIKDVWGSSAGYLKAVKDIYSPSYPWTVTFTFAELEKMLVDAYKDIGTLTKVEITKRNQSGAVDTLVFTGTTGTATYTKEKVRTFFGSGKVKSTMFSFVDAVTETPGEDGSANTDNQANTTSSSINGSLYITDGTNTAVSGETVAVVGADGTITYVSLAGIYVTDGVTTAVNEAVIPEKKPEEKVETSGNTTTVEVVTEGPLTITGFGYGHGVGMPQDSAIEMAKQGFTYKQILEYYYTGIEIK